MMEVPTPAIRKTSTCLTLPSTTLISRPSAAWTSSAFVLSGSILRPIGRCWNVGLLTLIRGA